MPGKKDVIQTIDQIEADLKEFRGKEQNGWILFGYKEGSKNEVEKQGEGTEFDELKALLVPDQCLYAYLRYAHKVELANTVKFAFIDWTPSSLPPMKKALLSTHKGQIGDVFKPAHVTFQWMSADNISEDDIIDKIGFSSGTKEHTTTKAATAFEGSKIALSKAASPRTTASTAKGPALVNEEIKSPRALKFVDEDAVKAAIQAVRNDADDTNWCLVSYQEGNITHLELVETGSGGLEECLSKLDESRVWYGFFRVTEIIDKSTTVKFGFFKLLYPTIKAIWKAKLSTHRGFITSVFHPFHAEFEGDTPKDLSVQGIMDTIAKGSGQKQNVVGADKLEEQQKRLADAEAKRLAHLKTGPQVATEATSVTHEDEDAFKAAIAAVRSDSDATTWMLTTLDAKSKTMRVAAQGSDEDSTSALKAALPADAIALGILRTTDQFDASTTIKFVYVKWKPDDLSPQAKSLFATLKGATDPLFEPYHTDIVATKPEDLTPDIVKGKVQAAAGTKDNVIDKSE